MEYECPQCDDIYYEKKEWIKHIEETHVKQEMIQEEISKFNAKDFTKAHGAAAHRDEKCKPLRDNCVRDRMLKGQLNREGCDNEKVHEFLK